MRIASSPALRIAAGLLLAALLSIVGYHVFRRWVSHGLEALLERADEMSWLNSWINAEPLYHQAELQFIKRHQSSKALCARVSQMPAHSESSISIPNQIALLRSDLDLPEGKDPETRLRILTILGMLEVNYVAGMARQTWCGGASTCDPTTSLPSGDACAGRAGHRSVPPRRHRHREEECGQSLDGGESS
ncbi:MAG: hypothetical protein WA354_19990 [Terracidiphilus sp.]